MTSRVVLVAWCLSACGRPDPRPPPEPVPPAVRPAPLSEEELLYTVDRVLCPSHFDNTCHEDDQRRPHRWSTGASGLDWSEPAGMVLAKLSLVDGRWVADLWFGADGDRLVDDKAGSERPPMPIATIDTGVPESERRYENAAVTGLGFTAEGFVVVAGRSQDVPGTSEERTLEGRFYAWSATGRRFEMTRRLRITSTWQGDTKVRRRLD